MNNFFKLQERGTTVKTEALAGFTTFMTMVYIVVVNPAILSSVGIPFEQVFMATIFAAVIGSLIMGLLANYPIAIAPGMGLNAYFVSVVAINGVSYQTVLGAVFLAGLLFIILTFTPFREMLLRAIPASVKYGITAGIGLFIAFIGLRMSGIVVPNEETFVTLGDLTTPNAGLTIAGLFITLILLVRNVKGALFIGMLITAIAGYFLQYLPFEGLVSTPPAPVFFDADIAGVFTNGLYIVVIAFLLVTLFDTTGTMIGVAEQANLTKNGVFPRAKQALAADAFATTAGAAMGTSPSTAYIESSSGVASGGRTGLTAIVVAILFLLTMFFSPLVGAIAGLPAITAPVLIIVGSFMMAGLSKITWTKLDEAFPAFAILLTMPLTSSIATGIAVGFITYPFLKLVSGKWREAHPIIYFFGIVFILQLVFFPAH
ncbi:NCS2 family permease [Paenalkalicoccus suaedae]|uniref:NCS2 family permease n=1 Tax=Paenalkalicoccus suaedae TaxID=2592382 RepID=A0A859FGC4_9BACI|nr:NCS2 family permease [Paenalkalicoccus suaedae]QKS71870.1 NCS2 family permease [Paenalkalicoccus suaedae]